MHLALYPSTKARALAGSSRFFYARKPFKQAWGFEHGDSP